MSYVTITLSGTDMLGNPFVIVNPPRGDLYDTQKRTMQEHGQFIAGEITRLSSEVEELKKKLSERTREASLMFNRLKEMDKRNADIIKALEGVVKIAEARPGYFDKED